MLLLSRNIKTLYQNTPFMCLCAGGASERVAVGRRRGQRTPHLRRVPRGLRPPSQLSALRTHLLRAVSPHARQEPTGEHALPPLPRPHLTNRPPPR